MRHGYPLADGLCRLYVVEVFEDMSNDSEPRACRLPGAEKSGSKQEPTRWRSNVLRSVMRHDCCGNFSFDVAVGSLYSARDLRCICARPLQPGHAVGVEETLRGRSSPSVAHNDDSDGPSAKGVKYASLLNKTPSKSFDQS